MHTLVYMNAAAPLYKHLTRSSQRRKSVARLKEDTGEILASHSRGAIGRVKSDRPPPLITKIMHQHLPTDARLEMWSGRLSGTLQWHMLQCTHPIETCARRDWYSAIRNGLSQRTDDAEVLGAIMACWADNDDGNIHTAGDDQERGWRVPRLKSVGNGGHWEFDHYSDVPTFDCNAHFGSDTDGDSDDVADGPSEGTHAAEERSGVTAAVTTAAGAVDVAVDWGGIEPSPRPARRATRLLYR